MEDLEDITVLGVVVCNNLMGGYYLEVRNEKMETLFTLSSVKEYADYVRLNRKYISATVWFNNNNVDDNLIKLVHKEASSYPDLLLVADSVI